MSSGAIRKQKYTDSTLLESTEAGKFEVACSGGVFWVGEIVILLSHFLLSSGSFNMALSRANCALKPLQSLSKWTPKIMTAMSMSKEKSADQHSALFLAPFSLVFSLFLRHYWLTWLIYYYKQLPVSVEFTKYGNTLFRPVKFPGLPTKPKKSHNQNLTPKKSHAEFPSHINFQRKMETKKTKSLLMVLDLL